MIETVFFWIVIVVGSMFYAAGAVIMMNLCAESWLSVLEEDGRKWGTLESALLLICVTLWPITFLFFYSEIVKRKVFGRKSKSWRMPMKKWLGWGLIFAALSPFLWFVWLAIQKLIVLISNHENPWEVVVGVVLVIFIPTAFWILDKNLDSRKQQSGGRLR